GLPGNTVKDGAPPVRSKSRTFRGVRRSAENDAVPRRRRRFDAHALRNPLTARRSGSRIGASRIRPAQRAPRARILFCAPRGDGLRARSSPGGRNSMPSQKLIRCQVRRQGDTGAGTTRYIPLEIFGLWDYMMASKHGFEVLEPRASLWLDMEDSPETAYGENQFERITEVTAF